MGLRSIAKDWKIGHMFGFDRLKFAFLELRRRVRLYVLPYFVNTTFEQLNKGCWTHCSLRRYSRFELIEIVAGQLAAEVDMLPRLLVRCGGFGFGFLSESSLMHWPSHSCTYAYS